MDDKELMRKLKSYMRGKSQRQAAKEIGISAQYLWGIINKKWPVSCPAVLRKFGLKKVVSYEAK